MPQKKRYLVHVDILAFGAIPRIIAIKHGMEAADIRNKFKTVIKSKIKESEEEVSLNVISQGADDWTLALDSKEDVFLFISKLLNNRTGYKDYKTVQLEIAIGIAEYNKWVDENKLDNQDETIEYLKFEITNEYRSWYKENNGVKYVEETFIAITEDFFNELSLPDQNKCELISCEEGYFYYLPKIIIEREQKITGFLKEIRQEKSDFSGALIDRIFVPPDGYEEIKNALKQDRVIFITGTAGYGKTYTTIRLLWEYYKNGYTPRWIPGKDELGRRDVREKLVNIEAHLIPSHIIYFEDPFGKKKYEPMDDLKERINSIMSTVKNKEDVYIIITSRKDVFEEFDKECYFVDEIKAFEQELSILQPAYSPRKRKMMLEKWASEKDCKWLKDRQLKYFVFNYMDRMEHLPTPHTIHDFVESTINTTHLSKLREEIIKYSGTAEEAFADEIKGLYDSDRKDRVLFLSFIFISEDMNVNFVKEEYEKMNWEKSEDFENILREEYRVKESSYFDGKHLEFSHTSYSRSFKYILRHPGCKKIFREVAENLLNCDDKQIRLSAVETLGKIKDSRSIIPLIQILKDKNPYIRESAEVALVQIGEPSINPLINALKCPNLDVKRSVILALGDIGTLAFKSLIQALKNKNSDYRSRIAYALGEMGNYDAVDPLINAFNDSNLYVQGFIVKALFQIGATQELIDLGKPVVNPLIPILNDINPTVRKSSAYLLGEIGDSKAVEPLIQSLNDIDLNVRVSIVEALGKIGDLRAAEPLIQALEILNQIWGKSADQCLQEPVVWALGKLGDLKAVTPLIQSLNNDNRHVRMSAIWALGQLGDLKAVTPLIQSLNDREYDARMSAIWALGKIRDSKTIKPLIQLFINSDENIQNAIIYTLSEIGISAVKSFIQTIDDPYSDIGFAAVDILREIENS